MHARGVLLTSGKKTHQHKSGFTVVLQTRRIVLQAAMSNKRKYVAFYKALQN
jgi:hypothetical protein